MTASATASGSNRGTGGLGPRGDASREKPSDLTSRPSREAANRLYAGLGFEKRETNVYRLTID